LLAGAAAGARPDDVRMNHARRGVARYDEIDRLAHHRRVRHGVGRIDRLVMIVAVAVVVMAVAMLVGFAVAVGALGVLVVLTLGVGMIVVAIAVAIGVSVAVAVRRAMAVIVDRALGPARTLEELALTAV